MAKRGVIFKKKANFPSDLNSKNYNTTSEGTRNDQSCLRSTRTETETPLCRDSARGRCYKTRFEKCWFKNNTGPHEETKDIDARLSLFRENLDCDSNDDIRDDSNDDSNDNSNDDSNENWPKSWI